MQTVNKTEDQQVNTLELVLKEILEEQQKANQLGADQVSAINQLANRVDSFNEKLENQPIISPPVATKPIEDVLQIWISKMEMIVGNQPKNVVKKTQILLYPEQHADLFYKVIFWGWVPIFAVMLLINKVHNFAIHQSDNNKEIKLEELKNDDFQKAWNYRYSHESNVGKRSMDSVMFKNIDQR